MLVYHSFKLEIFRTHTLLVPAYAKVALQILPSFRPLPRLTDQAYTPRLAYFFYLHTFQSSRALSLRAQRIPSSIDTQPLSSCCSSRWYVRARLDLDD